MNLVNFAMQWITLVLDFQAQKLKTDYQQLASQHVVSRTSILIKILILQNDNAVINLKVQYVI